MGIGSKVNKSEYHNYARVHMGAELNNALKILVSPRKSESLEFDEIKEVLVNHFDDKRNKYAESIKFRKIVQESEESMANFALRLKQGAVHCENAEFLDRMLIEQLLHGMKARNICDEIINSMPETFMAAYNIAQTMELRHCTITEIVKAEPVHKENIHKMQASSRYSRQKGRTPVRDTEITPCHGCGGQHLRNMCKFNQAKCFRCGKMGHISKMCRSITFQVSELEDESPADEMEKLNRVELINSIRTN